MREVSGSTWVFQLMIFFILIFACFLSLVISYSKAYRIKNEMLSIIEEYEGISATSENIINNYLRGEAYRTLGTCPEGWYGVDIYGDGPGEADGNTEYNYCFTYSYNNARHIYYEVLVFYKFSLPVIGDIITFRIEGVSEDFVGSLDRY